VKIEEWEDELKDAYGPLPSKAAKRREEVNRLEQIRKDTERLAAEAKRDREAAEAERARIVEMSVEENCDTEPPVPLLDEQIAAQPFVMPNSQTATTKARAAGVMLVAGSSPEYIADVLGFTSPTGARNAALSALSEALDSADRGAIKTVLGGRLEALFRTAYARANDKRYPQREAAMDKALKIIEQQMKLFGVAAPTTLMVGAATDAQIAEFVARVAQSRIDALPQEKDVIRGEIAS
jgi:hypothetical protein